MTLQVIMLMLVIFTDGTHFATTVTKPHDPWDSLATCRADILEAKEMMYDSLSDVDEVVAECVYIGQKKGGA